VTSDWKNSGLNRGENDSRGTVFTSHQSPVTNHCLTVDLGLIGYGEAYALQKRIVAARKAGAIEDVLLLCEHPHVITQGRNGKREHLLASENVLRQKGIALYETSRGGDITYHGPGQIVGYPILNLAAIRRDVVWYVRMLEEVMIRATTDYDVTATREPGKTGIWVAARNSPQSSLRTQSREGAPEKLGAIGVHISRWVTSHGFAYNVSTDLRFFDLIVPCGIADRKATSLEKLLNRRVHSQEVANRLMEHFGRVFGREIHSTTLEDLLEKLQACERQMAPATDITAQPEFAASPVSDLPQLHR
jgi:lipoyl(octanoyl) transferase